MKKLKNKVFLTISIILTCFLISILSIFNYQDYNHEKRNIKTNLDRLHNNIDKDFNHSQSINNKPLEESKKDLTRKVFMDLTVYTILLDEENNIIEVFSHNEELETDNKINTLASKILNSKDLKETKIGNLYISTYSYAFKEHSFLTIIDNSQIQKRLLSSLKTSLMLFLILEIAIIYLAHIVTSWIIKPVYISFNKQKQFIEDASHELKTPLAVIIANTEALENDRTEDKWLNNIKNETERMNKLVSDLLDLAKLERGTSKETYSLINLSKIIEMQVLLLKA